MATLWDLLGHGFKSHWKFWNLLKLYSDVNYTADYGRRCEYKFPFLDIFSFSENQSHITHQEANCTILREVVFPLEKVEFLGVLGVGAPRNIEAFLMSCFGKDILNTCMLLNWDHRREGPGPRPKLAVPCDNLHKFMNFTPAGS